jgi:hypothetical protein
MVKVEIDSNIPLIIVNVFGVPTCECDTHTT